VHKLSTSFVPGYHGCDRETGERLLLNQPFQPSENTYDWLGSGIYFWEANPDRALEWAKEHANRIQKKDGQEVEPFAQELKAAASLSPTDLEIKQALAVVQPH
jgi:hypothetical protein